MLPSRRLLVIGLDGATYRTLLPMRHQGAMPHLDALMQAGTCATLVSTVPPITAPAWTTILTGVNPGRHRIFSFFRAPGESLSSPQLNDSSDVGAPFLWDHLGPAGLKTGIVNVPMTYPPTRVDGFMVCTPSFGSRYEIRTFPGDLAESIAAQVQVDASLWVHNGMSPTARYVKHLTRCLDQEEAVALHVLRTRPWDAFVVVTRLTDLLQHFFWSSLDEEHAGHDPRRAAVLRGPLRAFFHRLDRYIGALVRDAGPETSVLVVSDHGFGRLEKVVHVNTWLEERGYLCLRTSLLDRVRCLASRHGFTAHGLLELAARLDVWHLRSRLSPKTRRLFVDGIVRGVTPSIDWPRSQAVLRFCIESGIYLRSEARDAKERIRAELREVSDSATGERVFEDVFLREELYEGPETALAPDILLQPREGYMCNNDPSSKRVVERQGDGRVNGFHRMEGILIATGPAFRRVESPPVVQLADVAPTALSALGIPVPPTMDGRPVQEILGVAPEVAPRSFAPSRTGHDGGPGFSPEDEEGVIDQLRSLGYL